MSTQRQSEDLIPNRGLNLAVPISKDEQSALVMRNWRPDRMEGRLRSRLGHGAVLDTFPAPIHTIWVYDNSVRFFGAGTVLYRGSSASPVVTGLDGSPLNLVGQRKFVWVMNRNAQKRINTSGSVNDWWVAPPGSLPTATNAGVAGNVTGDVQYYVTFEDTDGFESGAAGPTPILTVTDSQVNLTSIPTGGGAIAKRHIYRTGGGLTLGYRITTIGDNTTTTFTDDVSNAAAQDTLITVPTLLDAPPAARGLCHFQGRLVAYSTVDMPNGIFWTRADLYHAFPRFNYARIGDHGEAILFISPKGAGAWVYKERSIWRLTGDPDEILTGRAQAEPITLRDSLTGLQAIASTDTVDYLVCRYGVYRFDGYGLTRISSPLDPIFNGEGVPTGSGAVLEALNLQAIDKAVVAMSGERLYVSYPKNLDTTPSATLVYNTSMDVWVHDTRGFTALTQEGPLGNFSAGLGTKYVSLNNGQNDEGSGIPVAYQSTFRTQGAPDNDKQYWEVTIRSLIPAGQTLIVKAFFGDDLSQTPPTLGILPTGAQLQTTTYTFNGQEGVFARAFSLLIEGEVTAECQIESMTLWYTLHPRNAAQWMSDVRSFDDLMEVRAIRVEADSPGNLQVNLRTDGPAAGDLGSATDVSIAVTGDPKRRVYPLTLSQTYKGYLWQGGVKTTATSGGTKVYRYAIEARRIPIYLAGARSEKWQPSPRSIGT